MNLNKNISKRLEEIKHYLEDSSEQIILSSFDISDNKLNLKLSSDKIINLNNTDIINNCRNIGDDIINNCRNIGDDIINRISESDTESESESVDINHTIKNQIDIHRFDKKDNINSKSIATEYSETFDVPLNMFSSDTNISSSKKFHFNL